MIEKTTLRWIKDGMLNEISISRSLNKDEKDITLVLREQQYGEPFLSQETTFDLTILKCLINALQSALFEKEKDIQ